MTPAAPDPDPTHDPARPPWYRRRTPLLVVGIVVVVALAVVTDLPAPVSRASDITNETSVLHEVNGDIAGCALAVREAISFWDQASAGQLTASDRSQVPALLRDDQNACSFTNEDIFNLSDIDVPGTAAGRHVGQVVAGVTLWTTSDALRAVEAVQTLWTDPGSSSGLANLQKAERELAHDRAQIEQEMNAADGALGTRLPRPALPSLPQPPP